MRDLCEQMSEHIKAALARVPATSLSVKTKYCVLGGPLAGVVVSVSLLDPTVYAATLSSFRTPAAQFVFGTIPESEETDSAAVTATVRK